jgi:hypothetical protein
VGRLVVVVPLKAGAAEKARELLAKGPPFDLEASEFDRHEVYVSESEAVFLFETPGPSATLKLPGDDPSLWKVAAAWQPLIADKPRKALTAYSWRRPKDRDAVSFEPTPGPGDSEGGDLYTPATEARGS